MKHLHKYLKELSVYILEPRLFYIIYTLDRSEYISIDNHIRKD